MNPFFPGCTLKTARFTLCSKHTLGHRAFASNEVTDEAILFVEAPIKSPSNAGDSSLAGGD
jgi:hypothetical protein